MLTTEKRNELYAFVASKVKQHIITSFLSGSIVEGYSTQKSDYDVYVILDENTLITEAETFHSWKEAVCEITCLHLSDIKNIILNIKNRKKIDWYDTHLMHRILTAIPLSATNIFTILQKSIPTIELLKQMKKKAFKFSEKCFSDAMGNILSEDYQSAVFNVERTLNSTVDYLLAHQGCTSTLIKWRIKNFEKYWGSDHVFVIAYKSIYSMISLSSQQNMLSYVYSVARFWQCALDYIQTEDILNRKPDINESHIYNSHGYILQRKSITRNPLSRIIYDDGKLILIGTKAICEIDISVYRIWLEIDNSKDIDQLSEVLKDETDRNTITQIIAELQNLNAVK